MRELFTYAQCNAGAMVFLMQLLQPENLIDGINIMRSLNKMPSIRGTNLYILFNDLCDKDINKVKMLCEKCPTNILEDACLRKDYSGRDLVKQYLN